jgi:hypothetical protein
VIFFDDVKFHFTIILQVFKWCLFSFFHLKFCMNFSSLMRTTCSDHFIIIIIVF